MPSMSAGSEMDPAITGRYADGVRAVAQRVEIEVLANRLRISFSENDRTQKTVDWPRDDTVLLDDFGARGARFARTSLADARLMIDGGASRDRLMVRAPEIFSAVPPNRRPSFGLLAVTFLALGSLVGAYFGMPYLTGPVARALPDSWFNEIGRNAVEQIGWVLSDRAEATCEDPAGTEALSQLVRRLGMSLDEAPQVTIHVINGDMVNAFAAPGGHLVILRGLIDYAEDPAELVGVLAHELAHAVSRDAERGLIGQVGQDVVSRVLIGDASSLAEGLGLAAQFLLQLSHSREVEAAADELAFEMLTAAGLRTDGLASFFERLDTVPEDQNKESQEERQIGSVLPDILSTHPPTAQRAARAAELGNEGETGLTDAQWQAIRNMCEP